MGVVYRARDPRLHRVVAIKRIHPNLQGSAPAAERFIREARAIAAVSHPNIAQIFSIHDSDGEEQGFFVMEFVAGPSVEARASAEGGLEVAEAISIIAQASRGLAAALKRGIIHRDMKPSNLLLTPQGDVKIVDFGLASQAANVEVDEEEILSSAHRSRFVAGPLTTGQTFTHLVPPSSTFSSGESHSLARTGWKSLSLMPTNLHLVQGPCAREFPNASIR